MKGWLVVALMVAACGDPELVPPDGGRDAACTSTLSASPVQVDFGTRVAGTSHVAPVIVTNPSSCRTQPLALSIAGANASDVAIASTSCAGQMLDPGATCVATLRFTPGAPGPRSAQLLVDGGGTQLSIAITGTGSPGWAIAGAPHDFGAARITTTTAPYRFAITNLGGAATSASIATTLTGTNAAEFAIVADTCASMVLVAGGTCHIDAVFRPTSPGAKSAKLTVVEPTFGTLEADVTGTAVTGGGGLIVSPVMVDFGTAANVADTRTVTITNTGGASTGAVMVSLSGADLGSFEIRNDTCASAPLGPGASCTFAVRTTCIGTGAPRTASANVVATPGGVLAIAISATVVPTVCESFILNPSTIAFGDHGVGTTSTAQTVTLSNPGGAPLGPLTASLGGTNSNQFTLGTDTCTGVTLGPATSCTVQVAFAPTSQGTKNALLTMTTPFGSASTTLSGRGVADTALLAVSPATFDFGSSQMTVKTFTVTNSGGVSSGAITTSLGGANPGVFVIASDLCAGATLAPGATCTFAIGISCNPPFGNTSATVSIAGMPGGTITANLSASIFGKSCTSAISVTPTIKQYGNQTVGTTSPAQTFSVSNFGGQPSQTSSVTLTGSNAGDFTLANDTCTGSVLPVGGAPCTVDVSFRPLSTGTKTAALVVSGGTIATSSLSGVGQP